MSTEAMTEREREIVRETLAQAWETAADYAQACIDAGDQEAAANGNAWLQGRFSALGQCADEYRARAEAARA